MTQRTDRIDELLRQEIGEIFRRDVDDPQIGFATITDVETTPDLRHARMSVSVIGQPEERKATLAAMGRAMPFVRHELGKRLRLKRIPRVPPRARRHPRARDPRPPAPQRARGGPDRRGRPAHRRVAPDAGRAAAARRRRGRRGGPAERGVGQDGQAPAAAPRPAVIGSATQRLEEAPAVIDLSPWTPAVPEAVVARISSARRVLAVGHENPDADTIGSTLAVRRLVAACGGTATPVFSDPIPPLYAFVPDIETARTDPEPGVDYDLLVVSDCAGIDRIGAATGAVRHDEEEVVVHARPLRRIVRAPAAMPPGRTRRAAVGSEAGVAAPAAGRRQRGERAPDRERRADRVGVGVSMVSDREDAPGPRWCGSRATTASGTASVRGERSSPRVASSSRCVARPMTTAGCNRRPGLAVLPRRMAGAATSSASPSCGSRARPRRSVRRGATRRWAGQILVDPALPRAR